MHLHTHINATRGRPSADCAELMDLRGLNRKGLTPSQRSLYIATVQSDRPQVTSPDARGLSYWLSLQLVLDSCIVQRHFERLETSCHENCTEPCSIHHYGSGEQRSLAIHISHHRLAAHELLYQIIR